MRLVVTAAVDRRLEAADIEIVLGEIEMFPVARDAIQLQTVDRVALAARERRILRAEVLGERCGRRDGGIEQVALPGREVIRDRDLEAAVARPRLRAQFGNSRVDHRLQLRIGMHLEGEDGRFEHVAVQPATTAGRELRDRHRRIGLDSRLPETIAEGHLGKALRLDGVVAHLRLLALRETEGQHSQAEGRCLQKLSPIHRRRLS